MPTSEDLENRYQRPWFISEEQAYHDLIELLERIMRRDYPDKLDGLYRFFRNEVEELYLKECESYRMFWLLKRPIYFAPVDERFNANKRLMRYLQHNMRTGTPINTLEAMVTMLVE
jgi:hypothetical protein